MSVTRLLNSLDPVERDEVAVAVTHRVFVELFAQIVAEPPATIAPCGTPGSPPGAEGEVRSRQFPRRWLAVTSAAAVLALAVSIPLSLEHNDGLRGPFTTPWRAGRTLSSGPGISDKGTLAGSWQLVSDIVPTGRGLDTSNQVPDKLTCPTASACYVTNDRSTRDTGPAGEDSLYFSHNGGRSWAGLVLPAGFRFSASLSCSGADTCAGGGVFDGGSVFISTIDGGHRWTVSPIALSGEFRSLACSSAATCAGIVSSADVVTDIDGTGGLTSGSTEDFVRTTDGGKTWSIRTLPSGEGVTSLACASAKSCLAIGYLMSRDGTESGLRGLVLTTKNAGETWTEGTLPDRFGFDKLSSVACGDVVHCMALGAIGVSHPGACPSGETRGDSARSCANRRALENTIVTTSDAGLIWQLRPLPSGVSLTQMEAVSCPTAKLCWVSAQQADSPPVGKLGNYRSAVLLETVDGGTSWARSTLVVPPGASSDDDGASSEISSMSCPSPSLCVALDVSDQGPAGTPVYRYIAPNSL